VESGSVEFSGGFTNNGVIDGLVTQSGGVTTISAPAPSDFNTDRFSDILFQDGSTGQVSISEMNGPAVIGGGAVSLNPGPSWQAVGSADFNGDGQADILWQNANGQAAIWEMDGTNVTASATVGPNPGPNWKVVGTGDFNGDGDSDILWQNASGQVAVWEMDGTNVIAGGSQLVGPILGRTGRWSERASSTATAIPTSCCRTLTVRLPSGRRTGPTSSPAQRWRQSWAELEGGRNGRLQRRRLF
jgi:FG-GAP-like repeat